MASDSNRMEDTSTVELNPTGESAAGDNLKPVGDRPAKRADIKQWVAYCTKLGASKATLKDLSRNDLIALADRLGG